jgi:uncharacterized protein (TIGR00269 family)
MQGINFPDKRFIGYLERKVRNTIRKYKLFRKDEKIAVAVSGGKDSTVCLYMLNKLGYDVEAVTLDPQIGEYTDKNIKNITKVCAGLRIKLHVLNFTDEFGSSLPDLLRILSKRGVEHSSCMVCGILKRYLLNRYSRSMGFDCLATGHNLDDEAQAFVMNIFRNDTASALRQGPVSGMARSKSFTRRVKPLYQISEKEIVRYSRLKRFPVNYSICPCSVDAYRRRYLDALNSFEKDNPSLKYNIIKFHEELIMPLKRMHKDTSQVNECEICAEPASKKVCRACQILAIIRRGIQPPEPGKTRRSAKKKKSKKREA